MQSVGNSGWRLGKEKGMELKDKRVLVFGTGISGIGAAQLLDRVGARVVLYDQNTRLTREDVLARLPEGVRAQVLLGELPEEILSSVELVVLSPGVPTDIPQVLRVREMRIPIWGEVELAWRCSRGDVLAITGTNGKTTTTTLLGEIMKYHVKKQTEPVNDQVFIVGNIGTPYTGAALCTAEASVTVAEISSFQLETIEQFHPRVSAITNITPDHLDRHHTMEEYIRVKERIAENQLPEEICVLNYEDEVLRAFGEHAPVKALFFSSARVLERGLCLNGEDIEYRDGGRVVKLLSVRELKLPGRHNYENVMTAAGMALAYGVRAEEICHVLRRFTAVEHRIEYVAEKNGIVYYNDSKGTNPDAAIKAIEAMDRPTVLLGGGYDKGGSFREWIRAFDGRVHTLVLIGQTKERIAREAKECGFTSILLAETFREAFALCVANARQGDAVLLSPACASWGMFPDYEARGRQFKELVHELPD